MSVALCYSIPVFGAPDVGSMIRLEHVQKKALYWIHGRRDYVASLACLKILPICYQLIYTDMLVLYKLFHGRYEINVSDLISLHRNDRNTRASDKNLFKVRRTRKIGSWRNFFRRAAAITNSILENRPRLRFQSTTGSFQAKAF